MINEVTCYFSLRFCVVQLITQEKMPPKRMYFSLVERVDVIELNDKNRSAHKIAKDFVVGKT